jgi:hypothetical protein
MGSTDIDITLDGIVVLHYFSSVAVTLDETALLAQLGLTGNSVDEGGGSGTGTSSGGTVTLDLAIAPSGTEVNLTALPLVLENAWAVRALNFSGSNVQLAITIDTANITHAVDAGQFIAMSAPSVDDGTSNAATITFASPGLVPALEGDVNLTLDLTNAGLAGDYTGGGQYTLTATLL